MADRDFSYIEAGIDQARRDDLIGAGSIRSLLCVWPACAGTADRAVREPGMSLTDLARHLGISVLGVEYPVERGEAIARDNNYQLVDSFTSFFKDCPFSRIVLNKWKRASRQ